MFAPPGRTDRRRARPPSEQAPLSSFQSCSRCHALRSHRLLNVNTGRPIVPRTGKFHFSGIIVAASSLAAASIEDSEHVGADERHAAFAAVKAFRVQFGSSPITSPSLMRQPRSTITLLSRARRPTWTSGRQYRLASLDIGIEAAVREQK